MNFQTATTAEKLRFLADAIENKHKDFFDQPLLSRCVIGIGCRIDDTGNLKSGVPTNRRTFVLKFGVTMYEADALLLANYSLIDLGDDMLMHSVSPKIAADKLRLLAERYDEFESLA
jgi:hypothetical protein